MEGTLQIVLGSVIAAVVGALVTVWLALKKSRDEERSRARSTFSAALQAAYDYKEFPYAIRRRRFDDPSGERVRLASEMRAVQSKLSYFEAWMRAESTEAGLAYSDLVTFLRRQAGRACHDAWCEPPIESDEGMNMDSGTMDLVGIKEREERFFAAAQKYFTVRGR